MELDFSGRDQFVKSWTFFSWMLHSIIGSRRHYPFHWQLALRICNLKFFWSLSKLTEQKSKNPFDIELFYDSKIVYRVWGCRWKAEATYCDPLHSTTHLQQDEIDIQDSAEKLQLGHFVSWERMKNSVRGIMRINRVHFICIVNNYIWFCEYYLIINKFIILNPSVT